MPLSPTLDIIVIGAGISGLTTAYRLVSQGWRVVLLEDGSRAGGKINSQRDLGFLWELGPNSSLNNSPLVSQLINNLGLQNKYLVARKSAQKRYIVRDGKLREIPANPISMLTSRTFSVAAKLSLLRESFIKPAEKEQEESISEFVVRRLGREFLDYAVEPFIGGIYAGNADELSMKDALPSLYSAEQNFKSLIRAQIGAKKPRRKAEMFSFCDGMRTLTDTLALSLPEVMLNNKVTGISNLSGGKILVTSIHQGKRTELQARAVVLATPADASAKLLAPFAPDAAAALNEIPYAPIAIHVGAWSRADIQHSLDGFGVLVPQIEKRELLGTLFSSSIFDHRSPEDHVVLTSFIGGQRQKELAANDDATLQRIILQEQSELLGCQNAPIWQRIIRHQRAIPQYNIGHAKRVQRADGARKAMPNLFYCANWRGGISISDCIKSAYATADQVNEALRLLLPFSD